MTSVSAGHIILTPTQPVGSGRPLYRIKESVITHVIITRKHAIEKNIILSVLEISRKIEKGNDVSQKQKRNKVMHNPSRQLC